MHRAEGTLTTGTYISVCNLNSNENVAVVEAKGDDYQVLGTKSRNDENSVWIFESLGNDRYRAYSKKFGKAFTPSTYAEGALVDQVKGPTVFIFRETETKGEYFMSYDEHPSWYICPLEHGSGYKVSADPNQARWSYFRVDN